MIQQVCTFNFKINDDTLKSTLMHNYLSHLIYQVFDTSLTWQYRIAMGKMGLSREAICECLRRSIAAAYVDEDEKLSMRKIVYSYINSALF